MKILTKRNTPFALLLLFFIAWGYLLSAYEPDEIVHFLGITNVYFVVFLTSVIGGVSTFFAGSFYATIITFALGGLDPIMLGIFAGIGATIGDSIFFYFGLKGRDVLSGRWRKKAMKFSTWLHRQNRAVMAIIIFLYAGFTPFPKDLLVVTLAIGDYHYRKIILPLLLGNIFLVTLISYFLLKIEETKSSNLFLSY
jgi:membrane protein YqaA with SNARE-associated domain